MPTIFQQLKVQRHNRAFWALTLSLLLCILALPVHAAADKPLELFGDIRLRLEQDWDSLQGDGSSRDDRLRIRTRVRAGLNYQINEQFSALISLRTGPHKSQQSPHITLVDFDDGPDGPYQLNFDRWNLKYSSGGFSAWIGRDELSFWHQDSLFIFDNVTYPGVGATYRQQFQTSRFTWHLNYVALPVGMKDTAGTALIGQLVYDLEFAASGLSFAAAFESTNADPDEESGEILLTENDTRDYQIIDLSFQYRQQLFNQPFITGLDVARNFKSYDGAPIGSFSEFHKDDVDKFVIEFKWGATEAKGDWQFAYYYSYIEALAVNSSYISDDWVRWGNANQVRATNLKGSEFRMLYTIRPNMNITARLFFVDAIDLLEPGDTTKETGNRFRLDYNISF